MNESKANDAKPAETRKGLIYVVDDEPMLLELAKVILEPQGFAVRTFRDPELVMEAFKAASPRPDVLITDYAMHSMNGMQLVEQLRRVAPGQKILLVSGTVGEEVYRGAAARPDLFLAKPYQAHQLTEAIQSLIGK